MPSATMSVKTAWDLLQAAHLREARRKVNYEGADWYQITPEEQKVFGIDLLAMRWIVPAYRYYEEVVGITNLDIIEPEVLEVIRKDLAERIGMQTGVLSQTEFQKFAERLGISNRTAHAWFIKHDFWCVRRGITQYQDENGDDSYRI